MRSVSAPILLASTVLLAAGGCRPPAQATEETPTSGVQEREVPVVRTATIERQDMVRILEATSKLESDREVSLFPELPGTAIEILAEEGDLVREGQVLARLDAREEALAERDAEVALQEAKDALTLAELAVEESESLVADASAAARQAERDYDRDQRLSRSTEVVNPLSAQALEAKLLERDQRQNAEEQAKIALRRREFELEAAKTGIARAEVALERAQLNRSRKEIRAPFDGVVSLRNIRIGDSVGPGEAAFVVTDIEHVRATFMRPQEELALFSRLRSASGNGESDSLTLDATAEAHPGVDFEGWIERISPTIDAASGQFRVVARLRPATDDAEAEGGELLPGMLIRMRIVTDRHVDALTVPKRALRREGDRRFLLRVRSTNGEHVLERIDVDEGYQDEEHVEVLVRNGGTLEEGDVVVAVGTRELEGGDLVRLESAEGVVASETSLASTDAGTEPPASTDDATTGELDDDTVAE